jgi:hypothetical protein
MKLKTGKTAIISITNKTNSINCSYKLYNKQVAQCVEDTGIVLDCKLYIHSHFDYISSQCLKMLGLTRCITFAFLLSIVLYDALV